MTRWTHEDVKEIYKRAEDAEDVLMELVEKLHAKGFKHPTFDQAIALLNGSPRLSIKERMKGLTNADQST